jgi:hypothetical protein
LRGVIAERYACPVFFTLGAAGDVVPLNRYGDSRQRIGSVLGHTIVLAERAYVPDDCAEVRADALSLDVRTIVETDPRVVEAEYERARAAYAAALGDPEADRSDEAFQSVAETFDQKMSALYRSRLYPGNEYAVPVQFLKVGRTVLVGLPFEVLSEIGIRLKERFADSVLVSCAGGYQGYLPFEYEYGRGGYEASDRSTHFAPGTAERLLGAILDKLEGWTAAPGEEGADG